jgi:3-deoxy-D-manno-octulosonic-acid transferase
MVPRFLWRMKRRGGYGRDFANRFGHYRPDVAARLDEGGRIWIHAVSVGELYVGMKFAEALRRRRPDVRFVMSTTTSTAYAIGREQVADPDVLVYFPLDFPLVMRRVLARIRPAALILVEGELWPNLVRQAADRGIPVFLVNGRVSAHSFRGYQKLRFFTRRLFPRFDALCVQSNADRDRLIALGAPDESVHVMNSAKYEVAESNPQAEEGAARILRSAGINGEQRILMGGSTWAGEEGILLDHYQELRKEFPGVTLVLVPRHVERTAEVLEEVRRRKLSVRLRSEIEERNGVAEPRDVFLIDTTGELKNFYRHADVIFVGKSLCAKGGQNIIEPALHGKPVVVGPHMSNFPVVMEDFRDAGAICQVGSAGELKVALRELLSDPEQCAQMGRNAAQLVREKAGAVEQTVALMEARF